MTTQTNQKHISSKLSITLFAVSLTTADGQREQLLNSNNIQEEMVKELSQPVHDYSKIPYFLRRLCGDELYQYLSIFKKENKYRTISPLIEMYVSGKRSDIAGDVFKTEIIAENEKRKAEQRKKKVSEEKAKRKKVERREEARRRMAEPRCLLKIKKSGPMLSVKRINLC